MFAKLKSFSSVAFILFAIAVAAGKSVAAQTTAGLDGQPVSDAAVAADLDSSAALVGEPGAGPADPKTTSQDQRNPNKLRVVIYPVLAWAPIMGANVRIPNTPSTPGGGSGSTDVSLNGAAMFGFSIQKGKWYAEGNTIYAGVNASRSSPHVNVDVSGVIGGGMIGYKFFRDFYATAGFRHLGLDYGVTLGSFPEFKRSPGVWDPLFGVLWNRQLSKKWTTKIDLEGGGFGVGSDVDFSATGTADWQFAKHFGLALGYGVLHFSITDKRPLLGNFNVSQTLNGPIFGFGIYF